tara:strand:- start:1730 stop:2032 length:303 start_codon:yes stop_codon:yes gene_type:complete
MKVFGAKNIVGGGIRWEPNPAFVYRTVQPINVLQVACRPQLVVLLVLDLKRFDQSPQFVGKPHCFYPVIKNASVDERFLKKINKSIFPFFFHVGGLNKSK